ncbi:MAG TPA: hypothetical protein VEV43_12460 [Actinomycetota bacterium]|nr:hypothetical protein [Actinomycetota bacterium]
MALRDVAEVVTEFGIDQARIIGGHMVMLHVYRHGLGSHLYRATADADLGVPPIAVKEAGVIEALESRGYTRHGGNRYRRPVDEAADVVDEPYAVVDILVPAYTSRPRENRVVSPGLTTVEVPGLALALGRPAVEVRLDVALSAGAALAIDVSLPDEASSFVMKALAWERRGARKDIVDVWRMLEVLVATSPSQEIPAPEAVEAVRTAFRDGRAAGTRALVAELSLGDAAARERWTRIQALMLRCLPEVGR